MKNDLLVPELQLIESRRIKQLVQIALENAPKYFWEIPSSSTGNYHPEDENTSGGLVLHTKRTVNIGYHICECLSIRGIERDCVVAALMMHDLAKNGYPENTGHTVNGHGYLWNTLINQGLTKNDIIDNRNYRVISRLILNHMGRFDMPYFQDYNDRLGTVVQLADYLASRKNISVKVD